MIFTLAENSMFLPSSSPRLRPPVTDSQSITSTADQIVVQLSTHLRPPPSRMRLRYSSLLLSRRAAMFWHTASTSLLWLQFCAARSVGPSGPPWGTSSSREAGGFKKIFIDDSPFLDLCWHFSSTSPLWFQFRSAPPPGSIRDPRGWPSSSRPPGSTWRRPSWMP